MKTKEKLLFELPEGHRYVQVGNLTRLDIVAGDKVQKSVTIGDESTNVMLSALIENISTSLGALGQFTNEHIKGSGDLPMAKRRGRKPGSKNKPKVAA